jgi:protein-L-isoaspartate(D-aspartate) O-methyltransferase
MSAARLVAAAAEPFDELATAGLSPLLERIGDRRLVLLGEASHGTSEFYRMRARITEALIDRGFTIVAVESDWPDAARVDRWVRGQTAHEPLEEEAFGRFPRWMWRNAEVLGFIDRLRERNRRTAGERPPAGFFGLDLYSLYGSISEVIRHLDRIDPELARQAREHYGCLSPFVQDPSLYGYAALSDAHRSCEDDVVAMLDEVRRRAGDARVGERTLLEAEQNARVAANAEAYYRAMFQSDVSSWNLRDGHMFETLETLLAFHGLGSRAVVWAHNSHLGDASATEMSRRGELNLGQLVRERFGDDAYLVGFGTDHGTVAAASGWDEPVEIKRVRPARSDSYEGLAHESGVASGFLPVSERAGADTGLRAELARPRLERAIGVIYRPETERMSHYFEAALPAQFDEWIWFDESHAVTPLDAHDRAPAVAEGHPFAAIDA